MHASKFRVATGAALAGAGVLVSRSLGPKLHERCRSACSGKCGRDRDEAEDSTTPSASASDRCAGRDGC